PCGAELAPWRSAGTVLEVDDAQASYSVPGRVHARRSRRRATRVAPIPRAGRLRGRLRRRQAAEPHRPGQECEVEDGHPLGYVVAGDFGRSAVPDGLRGRQTAYPRVPLGRRGGTVAEG